MKIYKKGYKLLFKVPISINREKFYLLYRLNLRDELIISIADTEGRVVVNKYHSIIHASFWIHNQFDDSSLHNFYAALNKSIRKFMLRKILNIPVYSIFNTIYYEDKIENFDAIPETIFAYTLLKEYVEKPELFDMSYYGMFSFQSKGVDSVLRKHIIRITNFNKYIHELAPGELEALKDFKLPYGRVKNNLWTSEYRLYLLSILLNSYYKKTGRHFILLSIFNNGTDKEDASVVKYISYLFHTNHGSTIKLIVDMLYRERLNVDPVNLVRKYNESQKKKIVKSKGSIVGYYKNYGGSTIIRVVPVSNIKCSNKKCIIEDFDSFQYISSKDLNNKNTFHIEVARDKVLFYDDLVNYDLEMQV